MKFSTLAYTTLLTTVAAAPHRMRASKNVYNSRARALQPGMEPGKEPGLFDEQTAPGVVESLSYSMSMSMSMAATTSTVAAATTTELVETTTSTTEAPTTTEATTTEAPKGGPGAETEPEEELSMSMSMSMAEAAVPTTTTVAATTAAASSTTVAAATTEALEPEWPVAEDMSMSMSMSVPTLPIDDVLPAEDDDFVPVDPPTDDSAERAPVGGESGAAAMGVTVAAGVVAAAMLFV
mmetsp:Transcript_17793/g.38414  ORF Transcript_17793/g.38414 Transcript_17793/m.38414 type:complete len:237 (-) Transcript_17793:232-942(-)